MDLDVSYDGPTQDPRASHPILDPAALARMVHLTDSKQIAFVCDWSNVVANPRPGAIRFRIHFKPPTTGFMALQNKADQLKAAQLAAEKTAQLAAAGQVPPDQIRSAH